MVSEGILEGKYQKFGGSHVYWSSLFRGSMLGDSILVL